MRDVNLNISPGFTRSYDAVGVEEAEEILAGLAGAGIEL